MNHKLNGVIIIICGIVFGIVFLFFALNQDSQTSRTSLVTGILIAEFMVAVGIFLYFFEHIKHELPKKKKTQPKQHHMSEKDKLFEAFLQGFSTQEKLVLRTIREDDGLFFSTLQYRTGHTKARMEKILHHLEHKDAIFIKDIGLKKEIFLKKPH